ncbi:early nodulin-like protein 13 [Silene latifolia]|uniref:early nodulin-like protein 13 n=1 Tax=Silene latifolia TaxID=37657 RepID=UPI003D7703DC
MALLSSKIWSISLVLAIASLLSFTEARDHLVGSKPDAWQIPSSSDSDFLNKWAQSNRFHIADNLVWKYDNKKDSVVEVTREAYIACNTTNPIAEHKSDETKVLLTKAGPHYFISGVKDSCEKGEKLIVVVMSPRGRRSGTVSPVIAPAPATVVETPAVSPTSGVDGIKGGLVMVVVGILAAFVLL